MGDCYDDFGVVEGAHCGRCGHDVPVVEKEGYDDTGLCGWCAHMVTKDRD